MVIPLTISLRVPPGRRGTALSNRFGSVLSTDQRVPHISLVFRAMRETAAPNLQFLALQRLPSEIRVSHISRKTSEIWGTLWSVVRTEFTIDGFSLRFVSCYLVEGVHRPWKTFATNCGLRLPSSPLTGPRCL